MRIAQVSVFENVTKETQKEQLMFIYCSRVYNRRWNIFFFKRHINQQYGAWDIYHRIEMFSWHWVEVAQWTYGNSKFIVVWFYGSVGSPWHSCYMNCSFKWSLSSVQGLCRELKHQAFLLSRRPTETKLPADVVYLNTSCGRGDLHGGLQAAFCIRVGL